MFCFQISVPPAPPIPIQLSHNGYTVRTQTLSSLVPLDFRVGALCKCRMSEYRWEDVTARNRNGNPTSICRGYENKVADTSVELNGLSVLFFVTPIQSIRQLVGLLVLRNDIDKTH